MKPKNIFKILLFLILICEIAFSQQPKMGRIPGFGEMNKISYEILSFPSVNEQKSKLIINTRIPLDFMTFTRDPNISRDKFTGNLEMVIEIIDKSNNSVSREIFQKEISITESDKKNLRINFIEPSFEFEIKPDEYKIYFEISDKESQKNYKHEVKSFILKDFKKRKLSDISFISSSEYKNDKILFINRSGNIPLNENVIVFSELVNKDLSIDSFYIKIFKLGSKGNELLINQKIKSANIKNNFSIKQQNKFEMSYSYENNNNINSIAIPLQSDSLDIGKYKAELSIISGSITDSVQKYFEIYWINMPFSLTEFKIAQKKLQLITTKEEYNDLTSGSTEIEKEKFLEFWKKKDPTPKTVYNEVMAEFYRRVDLATMNYSTIRELDGSDTDRGKIFILNGKADEENRELLPNSPPREIWTYIKSKKRYIFLDETRQGIFKLIKIEDL
jgi:GWxTD domain-containing protein